jgi:hypothetical protein
MIEQGIEQARELGRLEGKLEGELKAMRQSVEDLCELLAIRLDTRRRKHIASLDLAGLDALRVQLKQRRAWPVT